MRLLGLIIAIVFTLLMLTLSSIHINGFFRQEQVKVDRKVYEQSLPYRQAQQSEFENLRLSYETTNNKAVCQALLRKFRGQENSLKLDQVTYMESLTC